MMPKKRVLIKWIIIFLILAVWTLLVFRSLSTNITSNTIFPKEDSLPEMYVMTQNQLNKIELGQLADILIKSDFRIKKDESSNSYILYEITNREKPRALSEIRVLINSTPPLKELIDELKDFAQESFWKMLPGPLGAIS